MTRRIPTGEVVSRLEGLEEEDAAGRLDAYGLREHDLLENLLESRQALGDLLQATEEVNALRKIWDGSAD